MCRPSSPAGRVEDTLNLPPLDLLRRRPAFAKIWIADALGMSGTWTQLAASAWLVHRIGGSALALALHGAATAIPVVVLGVFGGVAADRYSRRNIFLMTQLVQCVAASAVAALTWAGMLSLPVLIFNAMVSGACAAYEAPAQQGLLYELASKDDAHTVAAIDQARLHVNRVLGPTIAAGLMAMLGDATPFAYNAISYLPVVAVLASMPAGEAKPSNRATLSQVREGFSELKRVPLVADLLMLAGLLILCIMPAIAMLVPAFAKELLGSGAVTKLTMLGALGASVGALSAVWLSPSGRKRAVVGLVPVVTCSLLVFAANVHPIITYAAFALAAGACAMYLSVNQGLSHAELKHAVRGRAFAFAQLSFRALAPAGSFGYAMLSRGHSLRFSLVVGVALFTLFSIPLSVKAARQMAVPSPTPTP